MAEASENTEKEVMEESPPKDAVADAPKGSGLYNSLQDFLPQKDGEEEVKEVDEKKDDGDSTDVKEEEKVEETPEEILKKNLNRKLEDLEPAELIDEIKKNQRLVSERETKLKELEEKLSSGAKDSEEVDSKAVKALKMLSEDFRGNYEKIQKDFNLPTLDLVASQINSGSMTARLKQYQENVLTSKIEKDFGLEAGEFEYDPREASKAGTPSYMWDDLTNSKKQELISEQQSVSANEQQRLADIESQQAEDIKWYAEKYYDGNTDEVTKLIDRMNEATAEIATGKLDKSKHPFSIKNLLRGFYFDELVKQQTDAVTKKLYEEFAKHGMHLQGEDHNPTDLSNVKGVPPLDELKKKSKSSPMFNSIMQSIR